MQCINFRQFTRHVFDSPAVAQQAAVILKAILKARSPRLSDIARQMPGNSDSAYKQLQRFLQHTDPRLVLGRLFQSDAAFVIGDPSDMPRPHAYKTAYVGKLKDESYGYWLLLLATPLRGRAIPFHFVTYSSRLLSARAESRNQNHLRAFAGVKAMLGERPLVLDREFSYEWLLADLMVERVHFVIRLNLGSHPPIFLDARGKRIELVVAQGQTVRMPNVRYRGNVCVNLIGIWKSGLHEPLWIMSDLLPDRALEIYLARMKIEETLRDLKSLLQLDHLMNKHQEQMEKVVALVLLAFTIGYLVGEELRDALYGPAPDSLTEPPTQPASKRALPPTHPKRACFSGLFIMLKLDKPLPPTRLKRVVARARINFIALVHGSVRTIVRTFV
jgi:hypothetical protein